MIRRSVLILFFTFCLPLPALALLTFGAAPQKGAMIQTEGQAVQLATALQSQLGEEIKVRIFPDEATLHTWLNRYQQVDIAVFSRNYVQRQSAGEFFQLHGTAAFGSRDPMVLRQGVTQRLLQRVQVAVSALAADPAVRAIFQKPAPATSAVKPTPVKHKPAKKQRTPPATAEIPDSHQTAAILPVTPPESLPAKVEKQTVTSPQQPTTATDAPRIWLEQGKESPPSVTDVPAISAEAPVTTLPEKTETTANEDQHSRYSRETGKPDNPASPPTNESSSGNGKRIAGLALVLLTVFASFSYLRRRRRSAIRTVTFSPRVALESSAPIISAARGKIQDIGRPEEDKSFFSNRAEVAVAVSEMPHSIATRDWDDEVPTVENIATAEEAAEAIETSDKVTAEPAVPEEAPETEKTAGDSCASAAIEEEVAEFVAAVAETKTDEIEPRLLPAVNDSFAAETVDTQGEEPDVVIETDYKIPEPGISDEEVKTDTPWSTDEIELVHFDSQENPFGENVQMYSPSQDAVELPDTPEAIDTVNFDDSEEGTFGSIEEPYLMTSSEDENDSAPWDVQPAEPENLGPIDFSRDATDTPTPKGLSPAPWEGEDLPAFGSWNSELDPLHHEDKDSVPIAETPDYRMFFHTGTAAGLNQELPKTETSLPRKVITQPTVPSGRKSSGQTISLRMRGELGPSQVPALLKLVSGQKKAGTLVVQSRLDEKRIYFRKGKIAGASAFNRAKQTDSGFLMSKLGYLLIRQGIITEQERDHALEICSRQPSRRIGEVLVETCQLSYEDLKNTLRVQVEEIIYSLILFPTGTFEYTTEKSPIPVDEDLAISIDELLKEAALQASDWRELRKVIPSLDTVMEFKESSRKKLHNARMTSHQELVLSLINGKRTVQEICNKASMLELEIYKFLFLMVKAKIISPAQPSVKPS